jgi:NADH-quinone oxidoreductase subunit M
MGGLAMRAPVLAALFLIVSLATLAMPGSPNFAGELLILFGAYEDNLVYGLVASAGVVLAAVYMIRVFQKAMHNRPGPEVASREIGRVDLAAIVPLVVVILGLGVYPQLVLARSERDTTARIGEARALAGGTSDAEARPPGGVTPGGATVPGEAPVRSPSRPGGERLR